MKDNAQVTLAEYDGNARPGELVVDQTTSIVYVGNALGDLTAVATPGGVTTWALLGVSLRSYHMHLPSMPLRPPAWLDKFCPFLRDLL